MSRLRPLSPALRWFCSIAGVGLLAASNSWTADGAGLNFDRRVEAQRAIEIVYWHHRIWPEDNPQPKPSLATVLPEEKLRAEVTDYLKKSASLELFWRRPVTAEQLQSELDRMVRTTRNPGRLKELFVALGNDPGLIAETLVRRTLADRLIRSRYATDAELHRNVREQAESALSDTREVELWQDRGGIYLETTYVLSTDEEKESVPGRVDLEARSWRKQLHWIAERLGTSLPVGSWSALHEDADRFASVSIRQKSEGRITLATVSWPKRRFESWWSEQAPRLSTHVDALEATYRLTTPTAGATCVPDTWEPLNEIPEARRLPSAVWTGSEMIVWGGHTGDWHSYAFPLNSGGRYDPAIDSWRFLPLDGAPVARYLHTAVWTGDEMIVWGGSTGDWEPVSLSTGARYDPISDSWQPTSTIGAPMERDSHTTVWTGTEMIVWGGLNNGVHTNSGGRYDPSTDSWQSISTGDGVPTARANHVTVWTGSEMIVWGGSSIEGTGGRYDPRTDSWQPTATGANAPEPRDWATAVWTGTEMIVWGGRIENDFFATGGRYDPAADEWVPTSTQGALTRRSHHTAVWTGTEMIVWGGLGAFLFDVPVGARYDPLTDGWTSLGPNTSGLSPRSGHAAVWTGTEMIVWGGSKSYGTLGYAYFDTGGRFDLTTSAWTLVASSGAPSRRSKHTAVWTGAEMIVWGGRRSDPYPGFTHLETGGRYYPDTNTWVPTTLLNAPGPRYEHSVVWTGTDMIVWGGTYWIGTEIQSYQSGGRYNPITDLWRPTSGHDVPQKRRRHSAVWTGTRMIVWGGFDDWFLQTGGTYDPHTNSWTPISIVDAPTARDVHIAVWTGSEMVVWGGWFNSDTGGRYDPVADTWVPSSTEGAPSGRHLPYAVWSGTEMIVWGGLTDDDSETGITHDTGGRYNPNTDSWRPTSRIDAPSPRWGNSSVWTGTAMMLWGGYHSELRTELDTGAAYSPFTDSWFSIPTERAPEPRYYATAAWSGNEMLIFGGITRAGYSSWGNGGRYCAPDADTDGFLDGHDCAPDDATTWTAPGDVRDLTLAGHEPTQIHWAPPNQPGATEVSFDLLRSGAPDDFTSPTCLVHDVSATSAIDETPLDAGGLFFYLVRITNACGWTMGSDSGGNLRSAGPCP